MREHLFFDYLCPQKERMSNSFFRFKQFVIYQDRCAMKVGTDGVLLGAWCDVSSARSVLDVGTGTGVVSLMIAQRSTARVTAIEIDADAAGQARENVFGSPWKDRVEVINADFKSFSPSGIFDVIVSNPPYFANSLLPPDAHRATARHASGLTYEELLKGVSALLSPQGEFFVVVPADASSSLEVIASRYGMYVSRWLDVITTPGKQPKRCLLAFRFTSSGYQKQELLIEEQRHLYSKEFTGLLKEYYLYL